MDMLYQNFDFFIDEKSRDYFIKRIRWWGKNNYQNYPWREEKNLYRILLTEVCLQKTDSQKVRNLYHLIQQIDGPADTFDNLEILDEIVSRIGLNYKRKRIIEMSLQLLEHFDGKIPRNYEGLRCLYGVGDYIANAVLCFGFKERAAVVDTNTIRIIESFFGFKSLKRRPRDDRTMNEILLSILPPRKYVLFNYYLLDFGALLCVHNKKFCTSCLLKRKCKYFIINSK